MDALSKQILESEDMSDVELAEKIDHFLNIFTEDIQTDGKDTFDYHRYEPTSYRVLHTLFESIPFSEDDTLLDYGSGLGRLSFYANHRFRCHSIGVELSDSFHRKALENLSGYRGIAKDHIHFVHADATQYDVPDSVTVIYCFNPFSTTIFRRVMTKIEESYGRLPRAITLVLYYPEDNTVFHIERHTSFRLLKEIPVPDLFEKDRRERFCIYMSPTCEDILQELQNDIQKT